MYFLGVDGGGSKTSFVLISNTGTLLGTVKLGTCHYMQVGYEGFYEVLKQGIEEVCNLASIGVQEITYGFLGLPGFGEELEASKRMTDQLDRILGDRYACGNDSEAGWAGATGCKPGINIVSGTGSIAFGIDAQGHKARSGGWGDFCGDEGSAYWISKRLIKIFAKQSDGRSPKTALYDIMVKELGLERDFDLITLISEDYQYKRDKVAKLSKIAYTAAQKGDKICLDLFTDAAEELALCVKSLIQQLDFDSVEVIPVHFTGGVFESGEIVLKPLSKALTALSPKLSLQRPLMNPDLGSAYYAFVKYHDRHDEAVLKSLIR